MNDSTNENMTIQPTWWDRVLEGIGVLVALVLVGMSVAIYMNSSERVPVHFNFNGEADDWGAPEMVFVFAGIGVVAMLITSAAAYRREMVHMPVRLNPKVLPVQYALMSRMCRVLTLCVGGVFVGILSKMAPLSWHIATVGDWLRLLCMLCMVLVLIVFCVWIGYVGRKFR